MTQINFNPQTVEPREKMSGVLPAGKYLCRVTESDIVDLKSGNGRSLNLTLTSETPGYVGRKIWARLNIQHTNPVAERIAQQDLRDLCDAVGLAHLGDTVQLHGKPVIVRVSVRPAEGKYDEQNEVRGFEPAGTASHTMPNQAKHAPTAPVTVIPASTQPGYTIPPPPAAASGNAPPWAKRA